MPVIVRTLAVMMYLTGCENIVNFRGGDSGNLDGGDVSFDGPGDQLGETQPTCDLACDVQASCINDRNFPRCACNAGHVGNGRYCLPQLPGVAALDFVFAREADPADVAFGRSVALSADGHTLAVGDDLWGLRSGVGLGQVSVLTRSDGVWGARAELTLPETPTEFGRDVYLSGGAERLLASDADSVTVYDTAQNQWNAGTSLRAIGPTADYGRASALSRDGRLVAISYINAEVSAQRRVLLFYPGPGDVWTRGPTITGPSSLFGQGIALSTDGSQIAITNGDGAELHSYSIANGTALVSTLMLNEGRSARTVAMSANADVVVISSAISLSIFERQDATSWALRQVIAAPANASPATFGLGLAISADGRTITVSDYSLNWVRVYRRVALWDEVIGLEPLPGQAGFGRSVSMSDDGRTVAVGANANRGDWDMGSVSVFTLE